MPRNLGAFCVDLGQLRERNAELEKAIAEQERKHRAERVDWMRQINNLRQRLAKREKQCRTG